MAKDNLKQFIFKVDKYRLKKHKFIIISNNCWGFQIYKALGREYNTPLVGLFMPPESYLQFLENFENILKSKLKFKKNINKSNYPIGLIEDNIEIHFLHYSTKFEAQEKWDRRIKRLQKDIEAGVPLYVKFCDRDGSTKDHFDRFYNLPLKHKISIGCTPMNFDNHINVPFLMDKESNSVVDGMELFNKRYQYFDFANWIITGKCSKSLISRILSLIS